MSANSIKFSENSGNLGQNAQYISQMATFFVDFPEYSGHSNQFATSLWGFFRNFGKFLPQIHSFFLPKAKLLALATTNAYNAYNVYNAYKNTIIFFSLTKIT